jgi:putative hydrolase of HD superfamily
VETIAAQIEKLRKAILDADWLVPRKQVVIADLATDRFIATTHWNWKLKETNWRNVGIDIYDPRHRGKGLGYEALGLWTEHLFDALPEIVRLGIGTWSGNLPMVGLATKLGFLEEARYRRAVIVEGKYYDAVGYGVLREEWKERYPRGFAADALGLARCKGVEK